MKAISRIALAFALTSPAFAQAVEPTKAWQDFTRTHGNDWRAEWNAATGTPQAIYGPGLKLAGPVQGLEHARTGSEALLRRFADLLGKGDSEFVEVIGVKAGGVYVFVYDQKYQGLDVIGGRADVRIHETGVVASFGSAAVRIPAGFVTKAVVAGAVARAVAETEVLGGPAADPAANPVANPAANPAANPRLVIWANTASELPAPGTLAWEVQIDERPAAVQVGKAYIDARSGAFLEFQNEVLQCRCGSTHVYKSVPATGHAARMARSMELASRTAPVAAPTAAPAAAPAAGAGAPLALTGKVLAWTNTGHLPVDPLARVPMANLLVTSTAGNAYTDANGDFSILYGGTAPVTVSATLTGRHTRRIRVAAGTQLTGSTQVTPGTPATILIGTQNMGEQDRSQTTTYWFVDDVNEWLRSLLPGAGAQIGLMSNVDPRVNIASTCNAYYTNFTINFYSSGGGCNMTAFETVIQHEWGHGIDHAFGGISQVDGLSEGWGDILALYRSGQPEVGPGFRTGTTTGIRRGTNTRTYPAGGGVHQQGETWMGFAWDLRSNLIATLGQSAGIARAEAIVVASIAADATNQAGAVREVFILDDDDGNLNNGTPNYFDLEKAALKRALPYPKRVNPNAGTYVSYGSGCAGSGQRPANCLDVNATGTVQNYTTRSALTYAVRATAPSALQVTGFELYTSGSQTLTTRVYSADAAGRPQFALGTSTIAVGATPGWYRTSFPSAIPIASGQMFFVSFTNDASATNIAASIRSGTETPYFRNDGPGGAWNGPLSGFSWAFKVICAGGPGAVPELGFSGLPEINTNFTLTLNRARPNATGVLLVGGSDQTWLGVTLPFDLAPVGAPGCRIFASGDILVGFNTNAAGAVSQNFPVPNDATLVGALFFNQYAVVDGANNFGFVLSNAGRGKVGKQ